MDMIFLHEKDHIYLLKSRIKKIFMLNHSQIFHKSIYIKESHVSYTIYNSRTAEPIWLKIDGEVA